MSYSTHIHSQFAAERISLSSKHPCTSYCLHGSGHLFDHHARSITSSVFDTIGVIMCNVEVIVLSMHCTRTKCVAHEPGFLVRPFKDSSSLSDTAHRVHADLPRGIPPW